MWPKIKLVLFNSFTKFCENLFSKKFMVFYTCTTLLVLGFLTPELYIPVALSVLGVETALDWKAGGRKDFTKPPSNQDHNGDLVDIG